MEGWGWNCLVLKQCVALRGTRGGVFLHVDWHSPRSFWSLYSSGRSDGARVAEVWRCSPGAPSVWSQGPALVSEAHITVTEVLQYLEVRWNTTYCVWHATGDIIKMFMYGETSCRKASHFLWWQILWLFCSLCFEKSNFWRKWITVMGRMMKVRSTTDRT